MALRIFLFLCLALQLLSVQSHDSLGEKEERVQRIASMATDLFEDRERLISTCTCSMHTCSFDTSSRRCGFELGTPTVCGGCKGQKLDTSSTVVNTPPGTDPKQLKDELKASICTYRELESELVSQSELASQPHDNLLWSYLATTDGHFRFFPAVGRDHDPDKPNAALESCREYDPRGRPWYIAASTGPKDIVFVIDGSGSMKENRVDGPSKWNVTTHAVRSILDTLSTTDFTNIVVFSDKARQLWKRHSLAQASDENKRRIKTSLEEIVPDGNTDFDEAFKLAFELLTDSCNFADKTCSECEKVIIFLTDGKANIKPSEMAAKIAGYQDMLFNATSRRASIFTFSMGRDADDSIPRQIACSNNGSWSYIGDTDDPLTAMRSYYLFLAARRSSGQPVWSEPYVDDLGLGLITTVAAPFYSKGDSSKNNSVFLGVVGWDVRFSELGDKNDVPDVLHQLLERSTRCTASDIDKCQLQVLRNVHANRAACIDRFPITSTPPSEPDVPQCFTDGRSFYKRFSSLVSWNEARDLCTEDVGELVSIESLDELSFVASMASDDGTWIGAQRQQHGDFGWLDASFLNLDDDSEAWGIGQPSSNQGGKDCASIDTRGPTGNLNVTPCEVQLSFVCKYASTDTCKGEILNPSEQPDGYFTIPPISQCTKDDESTSERRLKTLLEGKNWSDVLCPLGEPKSNFELQCCSECQSNRSGVSPLKVVVILIGVVSGLLVPLCVYYCVLRKKSGGSKQKRKDDKGKQDTTTCPENNASSGSSNEQPDREVDFESLGSNPLLLRSMQTMQETV